MALDPKEKYKYEKDEVQKERRSFLKKTMYSTPTIVALGGLLRPTQAKADWVPGPNPSQPTGE